MGNNKLGSSIFISFIWKYLERFSYQIIQFVVQIILARILFPEDYGIISIIMVFIAISNVFIQSGFNMSLVQKKDITDDDYSSVFVVGLIIAIVLYLIIFVSAPFIAEFYNMPLLKSTFRVLSINLIIGALNSVQCAYLVRNLKYKKLFLSNFFSVLISGIIGIGLALVNFGVWALVFQQLLYSIISTVFLLFTVEWKPRLFVNLKRIKYLFSFGWKLLCSGLIDTVYNNIYELIIGKKFSQASLAYYSKAKQFPSLVVDNINSSVSSVMLTTLAKVQDNREEVKKILKKSIIVSSTILFPMMFGLVAIAEPLVLFLLTDKWKDCIHLMQLLCISYSLMPIHTMNLQAMNALGRSDLFLKMEIIKKICALIVLIVTVPLGMDWMVVGQIAISLLSSFINAYPNKKLLNYGFLEQMKDIFPQMILSTIMAVIVYFINYLNLGNLTIMMLQCIIGVVIYFVLATVFKLEGLKYIINSLKLTKRKK